MYTPRRELRSNVMKEALKTFIVSPVVSKYQVCAVRLLWPQAYYLRDMWRKRKEMNEIVKNIAKVVLLLLSIYLPLVI